MGRLIFGRTKSQCFMLASRVVCVNMAVHLLNEEETVLVATVRAFVDREVKPAVRELEHANEYPEALIEQMKQHRDLRPGHPGALRRRAGVDAVLRRRSPRSWRAAG